MESAPEEIAQRLRAFAGEAVQRSPIYSSWAQQLAVSVPALEAIELISPQRRQAPLLFAIIRQLGLEPTASADIADFVIERGEALVAAANSSTLQTNEPQRCAVLLPALTLIDGPIALIELGASAGLCLYPDRYSYRYRVADEADGRAESVAYRIDPQRGPSPVELACRVSGHLELPTMPRVVWRAGIDLHPRDARSARDRAWMLALTWPEETERRARIDAALGIAESDPPHLVAGDITETGVVEGLVASAPAGATVVVATQGVLPYLTAAQRADLIARLADLGVRWLALDPFHSNSWAGERPAGVATGAFALGLDGQILAEADPLGGWLRLRPELGARRSRLV